MWRLVACFCLISVCLTTADRKKKSKPPDIQIVETTARRVVGKITLDGRVRNSGEKPIRGLVLVFDFIAPGNEIITTQRTSVEDELLAPGSESIFRAELVDPVRAVKVQVNAIDSADRDLRVENAGPFTIE